MLCGNCHTPKNRGRPIKDMDLAGGFKFDEKPFTAYASNITPDMKTGIDKWTDRQIKIAITNGVRKDGAKMLPPMAYNWYKNITWEDLNAIVAYLRP